ncbi:MAG: hypothetical protein ABL958_12585 [Bdellovibrionia bacterium]
MSEEIKFFAIPTRGRPAALSQAADSYIKNFEAYGRRMNFVVADNSERASMNEEYRSIVKALSARTETARYFGPAEKNIFSERLAHASGVDRLTVDYTLGGGSPGEFAAGGNRNLLLLLTAGHKLLMCDDDTRCELYRTAKADPKRAESSRAPDPTHVVPFATLEEAKAALTPLQINFARAHESVLGATVENVRVRLSFSGTAGDSGFFRPTFLLWLMGEGRERLMRDAPTFYDLMTSRQIVRSVDRTTFARVGFCVSASLGLDNRSLLPPFLPVTRGEDFLFARLLGTTEARALSAFLPFQIVHAPAEDRRHTVADIVNTGYSIAPFMVMVFGLDEVKPDTGRSPEESLKLAGRRLNEMVSWTDSELVDFAHQHHRATVDHQQKTLERLVDSQAVKPDFWVEQINLLLTSNAKAVTDRYHCFGGPFTEGLSELESVKKIRGLIAKTANTLIAWPELIQAAKTLGG